MGFFCFVFFYLFLFIYGRYKKFEKGKRPRKGGNKLWKSCYIFLTPQINQEKEKKKRKKENTKIQKDTHEESSEIA